MKKLADSLAVRVGKLAEQVLPVMVESIGKMDGEIVLLRKQLAAAQTPEKKLAASEALTQKYKAACGAATGAVTVATGQVSRLEATNKKLIEQLKASRSEAARNELHHQRVEGELREQLKEAEAKLSIEVLATEMELFELFAPPKDDEENKADKAAQTEEEQCCWDWAGPYAAKAVPGMLEEVDFLQDELRKSQTRNADDCKQLAAAVERENKLLCQNVCLEATVKELKKKLAASVKA